MLTITRDDKVKTEELQTIYEYLARDRTLFLYGGVYGFPERQDSFGVTYLADTLRVLAKQDRSAPIYLIIDSMGGSVPDGFLLYDVIKSIPAPVYTVGHSCYSMAAVLLAAGEPTHRYIYPHSWTMLHLPSGGASGDSRALDIQVRALVRVKDQIVDILLENGVPFSREKVLDDIDRDHWMNARETVDYKLADVVLTPMEAQKLFYP